MNDITKDIKNINDVNDINNKNSFVISQVAYFLRIRVLTDTI